MYLCCHKLRYYAHVYRAHIRRDDTVFYHLWYNGSHDLTLQQLAQNIGINRFYLSQYFSRQSITYNTYINNLRINYFISRYNELSKANQPIVAQELANESGYRSYSTFSLAFKQRTGQSVTAWMREISD